MPLVYNLINNGTEYQIGPGSCTAGNVVIPDTYLGIPVKSIAPFAFQYCSSMTNLTMTNNITSIGLGAFQYTTNLTNVKLSENLKEIPGACFQYCLDLASIIIPNNVTDIFGAAFYNTSITNIILSDNLLSISTAAFANCDKLKSITIPKKTNYIGFNSFNQCVNLTRINFLGDYPNFDGPNFNSRNINLKLYRKKNFVTGWPDSVQGVPVVLWSDNVIKSGGTGKLTTKKRN